MAYVTLKPPPQPRNVLGTVDSGTVVPETVDPGTTQHQVGGGTLTVSWPALGLAALVIGFGYWTWKNFFSSQAPISAYNEYLRTHIRAN